MNTEPIEFSINNYTNLVCIQGTHHVETRDGRNVRILATDTKDSNGPVIGEMQKEFHKPEIALYQWRESGSMFSGRKTGSDLIIVSNVPKSLGWVGIYRGDSSGRLFETNIYPTREALHTTGFTFLSIHEFKAGEGLDSAHV